MTADRMDGSGMSIGDICRTLFRHKLKMTASLVVMMAAVLSLAIFLPRAYRSESILLVRLGRENVALDATTTVGQAPIVAIAGSRESEISTVGEILSSREFVERVVDAVGPTTILNRGGQQSGDSPHPSAANGPIAKAGTLQVTKDTLRCWLSQAGLFPILGERDKAIEELQEELRVKAIEGANLLRVSFESYRPEVAQEVVAKLVVSYLDEHVRLHRTPRAHEFLSEQTTRLRTELDEAEEKLRQLRVETGLVDVEGQRQALVTRIARLEDELLDAQSTVAATDAEVRQLRETLARLPDKEVTAETTGIANAAADAMREQLYSLQLKQLELQGMYTDKHFKMEKIREQIDAAREILEQEEENRTQVTEGPSRTFEETRIAMIAKEPVLSSMQAKAEALRSQLAAARDELAVLGENESRIAKLTREVELYDGNYRRYAESLEQARIDQLLEMEKISSINVVQPATLDERPVWPPVLLTLIGGLVLAGFGSAGCVWLAEYSDRTFKTPREIESKLNLPTLASIPRLKRAQMVGSREN